MKRKGAHCKIPEGCSEKKQQKKSTKMRKVTASQNKNREKLKARAPKIQIKLNSNTKTANTKK